LPSTIEQLHRTYAARGLTVLAVNIGEDAELVRRWVKDRGVTTRVLLDSDRRVTQAYRVTGTPTVVLIGRDGQLLGRAVGTRDWMGDNGRTLFDALLPGR
jgi:peroxiredoxin